MMIYIARSFKYRQVSLTGVPVLHTHNHRVDGLPSRGFGGWTHGFTGRNHSYAGLLFPGFCSRDLRYPGIYQRKLYFIVLLLVKLKKERAIVRQRLAPTHIHSHIIYF